MIRKFAFPPGGRAVLRCFLTAGHNGPRIMTGLTALIVGWTFAISSDPVFGFQSSSDRPAVVAEGREPDLEIHCRMMTRPGPVAIADPFPLDIVIDHTDQQRITFAELGEMLGPFHVVSVTEQMAIPVGDARRSIRRITLEAWESGTRAVPRMSYEVQVSQSTGQTEVAPSESPNLRVFPRKTPKVELLVASSRGGDESSDDLRPLADLQDVAIESSGGNVRLIWASIGAGVLLATGFVLVALARRKERSQPELADWARWRLQEMIAPESGMEEEPLRERWGTASLILRDYLSLRFGLEASAGTVDETVEQMKQLGWSPVFVERLKHWLEQAEMIAFAGGQPDQNQWEEAIDQATRLVDQAEQMQPVLDPNDQSLETLVTSGRSEV